MGLFSGSFGTGLVTGLASSVDRSLRDAIDRRNSELSEARKYLQTRQAAKLDAAEAKKQKFDEETQLAFDALATELGGDVDLTYAAFKRLGTAADVQSYLADVKSARKVLPAGQKYDAAKDFTGFTAGDVKLSRETALGQLGLDMPTPTVSKVSAADFAVDDPIGRLFGKENKAAEEAAKRLNQRLQSSAPAAGPERMTSLSTVGGIDLSRQVASQEAGFAATEREREAQRFDMEVGAFEQNTKRIDQAMTIAASAEARAGRQEASAEDQRAVENARAEVAALQRQKQLSREAEMHIMDKRAKEIGIEKDEIELEKMKSHPEFKNYEDMAVYATQKLSAGGLTDEQVADYERMRDDAIAGAKAYNEATSTPDAPASQFSNESRQAILNGEIKRVLEPKGLMTDIQGQIDYKIKGNEVEYFGSMKQALANVTKQTSSLDDQRMNDLIQTQKDTLNTQMKDYKDKAVNEGTNRMTTKDQAVDVNFTKTLKPGDVVTYTKSTPEGDRTVSRIWTGSGYI
jgi:hypothetical protein